MKRKYTEPCPHCGQDMLREPTLAEIVRDTIVSGIDDSRLALSLGSTHSPRVADHVMDLLKVRGISFVEADRAGSQLDGYLQGLREARTCALEMGSPIAAKLTEMIDNKERGNE